jgi:L,D-transpeptidase YcbB
MYYSCFKVVRGGSIMSELGGVLQQARVAVVGRMRAYLPCLALAGLLSCGFTSSWATPGDHNGETPVVAPAAAPATDSALIGAIKDVANNSPALDQLIEFDTTTLQQLYAARSYEPIWVVNAGMQPQGETLLATLERLQRSGALPPDADIAAASAHRGDTTTAGLAQLELLLSSALIRTAVNPEDLLAPGPRPQAFEAAAAGGDSAATLYQWLPPDPTFWRLRAAINGYQAIVERGGWPSVGAGPKLEPGIRDGRIRQIRQRMLAAGDLVGDSAEPDVYDDALVETVKQFQARHGLKPDGVIGFGTIDALNVPAETRLASMIFNLRRLYTQARDWGDNYVMVNLAAAQLKLVQSGMTTASYNVIVGRRDRPTPELNSAINRMEFNPYWNVPAGIYAKDFLPKLRKDPGFINHYQNIRVYRASEPANEVDPTTVDWFSPEAKQMRLRLRQDPGPENALGPAKFLFPNSYDVYLHGTNKPSLFANADRFLSSGCVRLPDPLGFAELLLKSDPNWSRAKIDAAVEARTNRGVPLAAPLPVHLVYDTAWVDDAGTVQFRADVYGRDKKQSAVAQRGGKG